jgi:hypothetical protein
MGLQTAHCGVLHCSDEQVLHQCGKVNGQI